MSGTGSLDLALLERLIEGLRAGIVLLAGASVGSFLNVVAHRVPQGLSIIHPRSRCPSCETPIAWYDNVPVLGYLALGGRCRQCRTRISAQYPLIEALCAVLALGLWWVQGFSALFFVQAVLIALLVVLALIDGAHYLLPESLTIPVLAAALVGRFVVALVDLRTDIAGALSHTLDGVLGAALGGGLLALIAWIGTRVARRTGRIAADQDAMGWGDVVLVAGIGAHVGPSPVLVVMFLASVQGAIIGALMLLVRGRDNASGAVTNDATMTQPATPELDGKAEGDAEVSEDDWEPPAQAIPFGPFLALGAIEWMLFQRLLSALYEQLLGWLLP